MGVIVAMIGVIGVIIFYIFWYALGFPQRRKLEEKNKIDKIIDGSEQSNIVEINKFIDKLGRMGHGITYEIPEEDKVRISKLREIRDKM